MRYSKIKWSSFLLLHWMMPMTIRRTGCRLAFAWFRSIVWRQWAELLRLSSIRAGSLWESSSIVFSTDLQEHCSVVSRSIWLQRTGPTGKIKDSVNKEGVRGESAPTVLGESLEQETCELQHPVQHTCCALILSVWRTAVPQPSMFFAVHNVQILLE